MEQLLILKQGCRVAVVNERGELQGSTLIYPHPPISQPVPAKEALLALYRRHNVIAIAIVQGIYKYHRHFR